MKPRPINTIASEIWVIFFSMDRDKHHFLKRAWPLLQPLLDVTSAEDFYGLDTCEQIILDFLKACNAWEGEDSTRLRAELRLHLYNAKEAR